MTDDPSTTPALLTAEQAGALLNLPPRWLLREARANRVPHVRFGRYVRFDPGELELWWRARLRGPSRNGKLARSPEMKRARDPESRRPRDP